jgi:hypothetical protein
LLDQLAGLRARRAALPRPALPPPVTDRQLPRGVQQGDLDAATAGPQAPAPGPVPLAPGRLREHLDPPPVPGAAPLPEEEQDRQRERRLVNALADGRVDWSAVTAGDLDHALEQLQGLDTGKVWRLLEALHERHGGRRGLNSVEVLHRHLGRRVPGPEVGLTPDNERLAVALHAEALDADESRRLAELLRSLPRVKGVDGVRGVPRAVFSPLGLRLGELLREEFPDLGVTPIMADQRDAAYGRRPEGEVARYGRRGSEEMLSPYPVRPPRPAPWHGPPPGPEYLRDPSPALLAHARADVVRHGGQSLLARVEVTPELLRWLAHRTANGDVLDAAKAQTLSEFAAAAWRAAEQAPDLLRHLGPRTTHWGLARALDRYRQGLGDGFAP